MTETQAAPLDSAIPEALTTADLIRLLEAEVRTLRAELDR